MTPILRMENTAGVAPQDSVAGCRLADRRGVNAWRVADKLLAQAEGLRPRRRLRFQALGAILPAPCLIMRVVGD